MEEKKEISLEIRPEVAKGTYSNLAIITHSHSEFIIDFATILPGLPKPDISNRIVMTPEHAKRLLNALMDNVTKVRITIRTHQPWRRTGSAGWHVQSRRPSSVRS